MFVLSCRYFSSPETLYFKVTYLLVINNLYHYTHYIDQHKVKQIWCPLFLLPHHLAIMNR